MFLGDGHLSSVKGCVNAIESFISTQNNLQNSDVMPSLSGNLPFEVDLRVASSSS